MYLLSLKNFNDNFNVSSINTSIKTSMYLSSISVVRLCDWSEPLAKDPQGASRRTRASVAGELSQNSTLNDFNKPVRGIFFRINFLESATTQTMFFISNFRKNM